MSKLILPAALALCVTFVAHAQATPTTTLTFSGAINSIYDGGEVFGNTQASYNTGTLSGSISFTPSATCMNTNNCSYTINAASNLSETLTFNGHTVTYSGLTGTLTLNQYGPQQISFSNLTATGFSFSSQQFQDNASPNTAFLGSPVNFSDAFSFAQQTALAGQNFGTGSGSITTAHGTTSIGLAYKSVSASTSTPTALPEPASIALLGFGMTAAGLIYRRRRS